MKLKFEILRQRVKVETKNQKVLEPNSYVCKCYRRKTGRGTSPLHQDEMKKLLTFYNKIVHFTLNNEIYVQDNGVTMDFPLGKILEMYLW